MLKSPQHKQTFVITGGTSGIGYQAAKLLMTQNPTVRIVLIGRSKARLDQASQSLEGRHDQVRTLVCDLADSAQIQKTAEKILDLDPSITGLVNNAGIYPFGSLSTTSAQNWDETLNVNLRAPFLFTQALLPGLKKFASSQASGARVVNISSTAGLLPNHLALAYSVSKAGLIQLTKALAKELGPENITVNCVCPGIVRTPLHEHYHQNESEVEQFYSKKGSTLPLGRVGEPQEIASAIHFFLSESSSWTTGEALVLDGGRLLV